MEKCTPSWSTGTDFTIIILSDFGIKFKSGFKCTTQNCIPSLTHFQEDFIIFLHIQRCTNRGTEKITYETYEELHNFFCSLKAVSEVKSRRTRWSCMETRNINKILNSKIQIKERIWRRQLQWEDSIKLYSDKYFKL